MFVRFFATMNMFVMKDIVSYSKHVYILFFEVESGSSGIDENNKICTFLSKFVEWVSTKFNRYLLQFTI